MNLENICLCSDLVNESSNKILSMQTVSRFIANDVLETANGFEEILCKRYEKMAANWRDVDYNDDRWNQPGCKVMLEGCRDARLQVPRNLMWGQVSRSNMANLCEEDNFGHDMPVWFSPIHSSARVMFVSQDPLRRDDPRGYIYLSSPFSLHCKNYREDRHVANFMRVFNGVIESGITIYATDYLKWFANRAGWVANNLNNVFDRARNILKDEKDLFNPDLIVTFGRSASVSINPELEKGFSSKMSTTRYEGGGLWDDVPVLAFLHPAPTNAHAIMNAVGGAQKPMDTYVQFILGKIREQLGMV